MRCPTLSELPPPPEGKKGWPWTEESPPLPRSTPAGRPWPCISIVTPSFNQGRFIEQTIRSVLLQGYLSLEYAIMDGGSADASVEVIKKYSPWLTFWVSESDKGQVDAVNRGFARTGGEVLAYINADDIYMPGALGKVGAAFADPHVQWVSGPGRLFGSGLGLGQTWPAAPWRERWQWFVMNCLVQPSTFWRRAAAERIGPISPDFRIAMDHEYWLRMVVNGYELTWLDDVLSGYRVHPGSITGRGEADFPKEDAMVRERHWAVLSEVEERKVWKGLAELRGRRLRWRAWREAWAGHGLACVCDLGRAVRAWPKLLASPKTAAVPLMALAGLLIRPFRSTARSGGGDEAAGPEEDT